MTHTKTEQQLADGTTVVTYTNNQTGAVSDQLVTATLAGQVVTYKTTGPKPGVIVAGFVGISKLVAAGLVKSKNYGPATFGHVDYFVAKPLAI